MSTSKNTFSTKRLVLIGLFSAICYVTLYFKIPIPAPVGTPFLHMGNMFVILAALLFSGPVGGLSGAIGMGLFDLTNGYAQYVPKVLILKFGMGLVAGLIASQGHKQDAKSPVKWLSVASYILMSAGITLFYVASRYGHEIVISGVEKPLVVIPVLYIFSLALGIGLGILCVIIKKIPIKLQYAILGAVGAIGFNLIGEFLWGLVSLLILGSSFVPAVISAAISLPATLINGSASIVIAILLYIPLSKALKRF